ncbi:hypothetical protein DICSQDRAFT_173846 [Dichomitus squalens LYAD-421 SS1]|uniref:Uncharacterized protein n=1 Tax=Dichomitus squalens (strain LYAD-421) TaxID=732165 RepID=R7SR97_DICSQ|nr:uncharacterized protein DICSQDRAFT_173846 [Dichomitus squalens LYAD-421 SS1]EJF57507.1 hypothetical protein DICSQDRAFT_173846 [Dichomitus squalens LYAD-421 SS1]
MPNFTRPEDFEIQGGLGRCTVCNPPGHGQWVKLGNLRIHEDQRVHKNNVEQKLRREREAQAAAQRRMAPPLLPVTGQLPSPQTEFDVEFEYSALTESSSYHADVAPLDNSEAGQRTQRISLAMQNALAGRVFFTAGEESSLAGGDSEVTLEDVLAGAGILRAIMRPEEEEEEEVPVHDGYEVSEDDPTGEHFL